MTGKTHIAIGLASCLALAVISSGTIAIAGTDISPMVGLLATIPGSLAPDVGIAGSVTSNKVTSSGNLLRNRGITHTLLVPFVLCAVLYCGNFSLIVASQIFGILWGWIMHILADMFVNNSKAVVRKYKVQIPDADAELRSNKD